MVRFVFGLNQELRQREAEERFAHDTYLDARADRLEAEAALLALRERRWRLSADGVDAGARDEILQEEFLRLDDEERTLWASLIGQEERELRALDHWRHKRLQTDLLSRLREAERDQVDFLPRAA